MPDETNQGTNLHELDRKPASGDLRRQDMTEHADLKHRLEADTDDQLVTSVPVVAHTNYQQNATPTSELPQPGAGLLVLQWLVYAFWGWTIFILSFLTLSVVTQLLNKNSDPYGSASMSIAYLLAAAIVLFIVAFISDIFYAKAENSHAKSSGWKVIMLIHAVIFALLGISALIGAVFGGVTLLISVEPDTTGPLAAMITGFAVFVLYGLVLLRTMQPKWLKGFTKIFWAVIAVVTVVTFVLGVIGPASVARQKAQDQVIERGLPDLASEINTYAQQNGKLPSSLKDLGSITDDNASKLVDGELVEYKPGERLSVASLGSGSAGTLRSTVITADPVYHYELCVNYNLEDESQPYDDYPVIDPGTSTVKQYDTSVSTHGHDAGRVCYDVQTNYSYDYGLQDGTTDGDTKVDN